MSGRRPRVLQTRFEGASYSIHIVGAKRAGLRDAYHLLLRMPWSGLIGCVCGAYLFLNSLFALLFTLVGGVANMPAGSFAHAFFFSAQTLGTIGYGAMYPTSMAANLVVVVESVVGLLFTALSTGLVFVRFSTVRSRVVFSNKVVISLFEGVPTISLRVGNERGNEIFDAVATLTAVRTCRGPDGDVFYRSLDLPLVRDRSTSLTRSWTLQHRLGPASPLHGETPETFQRDEIELNVTVRGIDDTSLQPVHARQTYERDRIVWGARLADLLSERPNGDLLVDVRRFHDVVATEPCAEFPYSNGTRVEGS
jgi:inward rectifier potassium channel